MEHRHYEEKLLKARTKKRKAPKKTNRLRLACKLAQLKARLTETDADGFGRCVSCGKPIHWQEGSGGHFQPKGRNYNGACLDERNVHLQCSGCNLYLQGNPAGYNRFMVERYGDAVIEEIAQMSYKLHDRWAVDKYIAKTRRECRELAKTKNFTVNI